MSEQQKFPIKLKHPAFAPAVLVQGHVDKTLRGGSPVRFPDVIVNNDDQLQEYLAKGYAPAGVYVEGPAPIVAPEDEYPKWVRGVLCQNSYEEDRAMISVAEANSNGQFVSQVPPMPTELEDQLRDALVARAKASGLNINFSGTAEEIRAEVQKAVMGG